MRKLIYSFMVSLDGYLAGPNDDLSWPLIDAEIHQFANDEERQNGTLLYGRKLWELMYPAWSTADQNPDSSGPEIEYAKIWQAAEKVVFSRTLESIGGGARLVRGDALAEMRRLKALPGKSLSVGGAGLASSIVQAGLVDEYGVYIHPVLLGGGTPMFPALEQAQQLSLEQVHTFQSGVVYLRYRVDRDRKSNRKEG